MCQDLVASPEAGNGGAYGSEDAGGFDPQRHRRRRAYVPAASPDDVVPVGRAGGIHLDEDTVRLWARRVGYVKRPNGSSKFGDTRASHQINSAARGSCIPLAGGPAEAGTALVGSM